MKTEKEIMKLIKESCLSDDFIEFGLQIHKDNPGLISKLIELFETEIEKRIKLGACPFEAFLIIRNDVPKSTERHQLFYHLTTLVGCISKYQQDIIAGEMITTIKTRENGNARVVALFY